MSIRRHIHAVIHFSTRSNWMCRKRIRVFENGRGRRKMKLQLFRARCFRHVVCSAKRQRARVDSTRTRASYNGITLASQAKEEGSTPFARSRFLFLYARICDWKHKMSETDTL